MDQLLDPIEKEVRNPAIVNAFRRIGLSDQAGTGMRSIFSNWRDLEYIPPIIENDKAEKTFNLVLQKERLLTERQHLFQAQLGVSLSDQEEAVFAYACRSNTITVTDTKAIIGGGNRDAGAVLDRLVAMAMLRPIEDGVLWDVVEHLKERFRQADQTNSQPGSNDTGLVTPALTNLTDGQRKVIELCEVPRKRDYLMHEIWLAHRTSFGRRHLEPLIQAKLIRFTHPDEPTHPDQAYVVTDAGLSLLINWKAEDGGDGSQ